MADGKNEAGVKMVPARDVATHGLYIATYFLSIIIIIATVKVTKNSDAVAYISFAATLSSLILAIIAIYIGISGNSALSNFVYRAERLTQQGFETQKQLEGFTADNAVSSQKISQQAENFSVLFNELRSITSTVDVLNEKLDTGFAGLKTTTPSQRSDTLAHEDHAISLEVFLKAYSFFGIIVAYYCQVCAENFTLVDIRGLSDSISTNYDYLLGCYMSMLAMNLVQSEAARPNDTRISSTVFSTKALLTEIQRRIETETDINSQDFRKGILSKTKSFLKLTA